jgi:Flp pilus assembly protein CpaB
MYTSGADERAEDKVQLVDAFVAAADIGKGTSGDVVLSEGLIKPEKVLAGSVPPSAVTDSSTLQGKIAASTISQSQFITESSFVAPSEGGGGTLATAIGDPNRVAVTVNVDAERSVANQIAPGDKVDIAQVTESSASYLLEDVKVLAVGQTTASTAAEGQPVDASGLITFEVTPDNALKVASAAKSGSLYLTLRPLANDDDGGGGGNSFSSSGG